MLPLAAQEVDNPPTLPPNYKLVRRLVKKASSPYFYDSLLARFNRCDTSFTIDDARCLYYGGTEVNIFKCYRNYWMLLEKTGRHEGAANAAWWQYQMLVSAVWSTGDGSEERPLHVQCSEDFIHFQMEDNLGETIALSERRGRRVYHAYPLPDGTLRWYFIQR